MQTMEFWNDPITWVTLTIAVLVLAVFLINFVRNRYRLRSGVLFFITLISWLLFLSHVAILTNYVLVIIMIILGVILGFLLFLSVILLLISLFYNGIILLRREGVSITNLLSLVLFLHLIMTPVMVGSIGRIRSSLLLEFIVGFNGILTVYFLLMAVFYVTSGVLVIVTSQRRAVDYIIVLGCGLKQGKEVTPLLAGRVDSAIKLFQRDPQRSMLVCSGGQGPDEQVSEAQAMKDYALKRGIPEDRILLEEKSRDTIENMRFSKQLIDARTDAKPKIAYATNRYHQFRAGACAHDAGMNIRGVGSRTKTYFEQNAIIREFIAMIARDQKMHMIFISIFLLLYLFILISKTL